MEHLPRFLAHEKRTRALLSLACPSQGRAGALLSLCQDARPVNPSLPEEESGRGDPERSKEDEVELVELPE